MKKYERVDVSASIAFLSHDKRFMEILQVLPRPVISPSRNYYASLVRSIIYQQLSGSSAGAIYQRFLLLFPERKFPKPEEVCAISFDTLRSAGLSGQKATYIIDLSKNFATGVLKTTLFTKMSDEQIIEHLTLVKGIGEWSAQMFLIFALNRGNVLPVGDLGIQKGTQIFFRLKKLPNPKEVKRLAEPFAGHHTVFSLYLWKIADAKKTQKEIIHK